MNDDTPTVIDDDDILPEPAPSASTRVSRASRRKAARRRAIIAVIVVALVLGAIGAAAAYITSRPEPLDKRYVTVAAVAGDLSETLGFTGTVDKSNQTTASFPADGKVTSVLVAVGDKVEAGQPLAKMATTDLKQAVDTAQANYDQAKLTLQQLTTTSSSSASSSKSSSNSSSKSSSSSNGKGKGKGGGGGGGGTIDFTQAVAAAKANLQAAQQGVEQADEAMAEACEPLLAAANVRPPVNPPDPTQPTSDPVDLTADDVQACTDALTAQAKANQLVSAAGDALANLSQQISDTLNQYQVQCAAMIKKTAQQAAQQAGQRLAQSLAQSYTGGAANSSETQKVAAQIAVDQADDALSQAKLNLANATLTSPMDGTIADIPFQKGDQMTTADAITIIGSGGITVSLSVPVGKISQIQVGQTAVVEELGVGSTTGKVSVVNLAPAAAGGSTYQVTVASSDETANALLGGVNGIVTISVGSVDGAVLVPVSAVTMNTAGTSGTVMVLGSDAVQTVDVQIGGVGATQVAISQGVSVGDKVVIADLDQALPTSLNGLQRALGGGGAVYIGNSTSGGGNRPGNGQPSG